jgi:hypothetical protein
MFPNKNISFFQSGRPVADICPDYRSCTVFERSLQFFLKECTVEFYRFRVLWMK